jgi:hypothetical protein
VWFVKTHSEEVRGIDAEEDDDLSRMEILKMIFVVAVDVSETGTNPPPSLFWPACHRRNRDIRALGCRWLRMLSSFPLSPPMPSSVETIVCRRPKPSAGISLDLNDIADCCDVLDIFGL